MEWHIFLVELVPPMVLTSSESQSTYYMTEFTVCADTRLSVSHTIAIQTAQTIFQSCVCLLCSHYLPFLSLSIQWHCYNYGLAEPSQHIYHSSPMICALGDWANVGNCHTQLRGCKYEKTCTVSRTHPLTLNFEMLTQAFMSTPTPILQHVHEASQCWWLALWGTHCKFAGMIAVPAYSLLTKPFDYTIMVHKVEWT